MPSESTVKRFSCSLSRRKFRSYSETVCRVIDEISPNIVLCVGEAGGRKAVTPERIAVNIRDARIPDNKGQQPTDEKIVPDGPDGYFSTLPIKEMTAAMKNAGYAAEVSNTAGTFVCNDLMYGVLHHLAQKPGSGPVAGFIHVPAERTVTSVSAEALTEALKVFG